MAISQIKDSLSCTYFYQEAQEVEVNQPNHHIWLIDRSGSMWNDLDDLVEHVKSCIDLLKIGDYLSIGYFSSEGEFRFPINGVEVTEKEKFKTTVQSLLDKFKTPLNLTCFSEILLEVVNLQSDYSNLVENTFMFLLTDGFPVVRDPNKELSNILLAADKLSEVLSFTVLIGYGDYYNHDLLHKIQCRLGNSQLFHCSEMEQVKQVLLNFNFTVSSYSTEVINLPEDFDDVLNDCVYLLREKEKSPLSRHSVIPNGDGYKVALPKPEYASVYFYFSQLGETNEVEVLPNFLAYALASVLYEGENVEDSQHLMARIGDLALAKKISNTYSPTEKAALVTMLSEACFNKSLQYMEGYSDDIENQLNKTLSVLQLLKILKDKNSQLLVSHPAFQYKSVNQKLKYPEGSLKFKTDNQTGLNLSKLVWNEKRLNLSLGTVVPGTVKLPLDKKLGDLAGQDFETVSYRTYTIIQEGRLNVTKLPVRITEPLFNQLTEFHQEGYLKFNYPTYDPEMVYILDLSNLPVVSKADVLSSELETSINQLLITKVDLGAKCKVINAFLKGQEPEVTEDWPYSDEQTEVLNTYGLKLYGFNPEPIKQEIIDRIPVVEAFFKCNTRGYASMPTVDKVIEAGQKNSAIRKTMYVTHVYLQSLIDSGSKLEEIKLLASKLKKQLDEVNQAIGAYKFTKIIANQSIPDSFKGTYLVDGEEVELEFELVVRDAELSIKGYR